MSMTTADAKPPASSVNPKGMLIGGEWVDAPAGQRIEVENPRRAEPIGERAARRRRGRRSRRRGRAAAFPAGAVAPRERGRRCSRIADALEASAEELARTIARETGNAIRTQARGEARCAADVFRYFGGVAERAEGRDPAARRGHAQLHAPRAARRRRRIVPWNAPVLLASLKVATALCTGNTHRAQGGRGRAARRAADGRDLPARILPAGRAQRADRLRRGVRRRAAQPPRHPQALVHRLDRGRQDRHARRGRADPAGVAGARRQEPRRSSIPTPTTTGRSTASSPPCASRARASPARPARACSCTAGIFDDFLGKLAARHEQLVVGDPLDEATDIGSIISARSSTAVCGYVAGGPGPQRRELVIGGLPPDDGPAGRATSPCPTVFAGVERLARRARGGLRAGAGRDPLGRRGEVIRMANDTHYGLAAFVWTHDIGTGAPRRARDRGRLGPGQPERRPAAGHVLRRLEAERHRPRVSRSRACSRASPSARL